MKNKLHVLCLLWMVSLARQLACGAGLEDLTTVDNAEKLAPGIWRITIGDMSGELRYTDYAAAPPRMEALNAKSDPAYPFGDSPLSFYKSPDNRIMDGAVLLRRTVPGRDKIEHAVALNQVILEADEEA